MLPIVLDASRLRIALIGSGDRADRRAGLLAEGGVRDLARFDEAPADFAGFDLVYFTEANPEAAAKARAQGALVNVEDVREFCDFHTPAMVRRGSLTVTVSTEGCCAGLSAVLAQYLGKLFDKAWALRLGILEAKRATWRAEGLTHPQIRANLAAAVGQAGWLPALPASDEACARSQSQNSDTLRKTSFGGGHTIK
jgi:precorrin-2 dehydrogenase/sirohydrochlorin ferrochelatase